MPEIITQPPHAAHRPPWLVAAAVVFLLAVQIIAIGGLRGVADSEGYPLNTSKKFGLNVFEDDGILGLHAALGYSRLHEDRFSYLFGVGGPVLHAAKPVMRALDSLGVITRFEDPALYQLYPQELERAYKAFATYQLLAFTMWLPVAAYLLLSRHVSPRAGVWGAWLLALSPFLTGFETRIKPDSAALLFGLLSLNFGLAHLKAGKTRALLLAWGLLGLSVSIKLTCAPFVLVLFWLAWTRSRRMDTDAGWLAPAAQGCAVFLAVFITANPLFLTGLANIVAWLSGYSQAMHASATVSGGASGGPGESLGVLLTKISSLDVFFGPILRWIYPAMLCCAAAYWAWNRFPAKAWSVLCVSCLLQIAYMFAVSGAAFTQITYYHYTSTTLGIMLLACVLGVMQGFVESKGAWAARVALAALVCVVLLPLAHADLKTLAYVTSPTNRQLCHSWIAGNIPAGTHIGIGMASDSQPVNEHLRIDPFRYQVTPVGRGLEALETAKPAFLVLHVGNANDPARAVPDYTLVSVFDHGRQLPRDQIGLFQDEIFRVYARTSAPLPASGTAHDEEALGTLIRNDNEPGFTVLQYQALRFHPISMTLMRKQGNMLAPFPTSAFTSWVRHESSPPAYVHHLGPATLALWGVKYVWARQDSAFAQNVLDAGFPVAPVQLHDTTRTNQTDRALFRFGAYQGQALFAPDHPWQKKTAARGILRIRPLPGAGTLIEASGSKVVEARLELESDCPVDVILKNGSTRQPYLAGPGRTTLLVPFDGGGKVEYEVNPAQTGGSARVLEIAARELMLQASPVVTEASADPQVCFAQVDAQEPGRVFFALPWHARWEAQVDQSPVQPEPGPAGVVAVPVPAGKHFVTLRFAR